MNNYNFIQGYKNNELRLLKIVDKQDAINRLRETATDIKNLADRLEKIK